MAQVPTVNNPFKVLVNPSGTRAYVLGRDGAVQVLDLANQFQERARYSLGATIAEASLTPDGKKLLLLVGELATIDLSTDNPGGIPRISAGVTPNDIAVSTDSRYAYIVSTPSRLITVVDLTNNTQAGSQTFTEFIKYAAVGPNGLLYVSATNRLLEIDFRPGSLTARNTYNFDADPGRPVFSPSGNIAVLLNENIGTVASVAVDLRTRTVTTAAPVSPLVLSNLVVPNESTAYCIGALTTFSFGIAPASPPAPAATGLPGALISLKLSDEFPAAKYMYGLTAGNLNRVLLEGLPTPSVVQFGSTYSELSFAATTSTQPATTLRTTATLPLQVASGGSTVPLTVRALDGSGRPVSGAAIIYTSTDPGVAFSPASAVTNAQGYASVRAQMPVALGNYVVRAQTSTGVVTDMSIAVTAAPTTTQTQFTLFSGNGQLITSGQPSQPLQVRLVDSLGAAVAGATVNWSVKAGNGISIAPSSLTDVNGYAQATVTTFDFTPAANDAVRPFTINASTVQSNFAGNLDIYGVVYPSSSAAPIVPLQTTLGGGSGSTIILGAGAIIPNAFSAIITSSTAGLTGPIPNVGMRAVLNATNNGPSVYCRDNPVSNSSGLVSCALVVGTNLGSATLTVVVGESAQFVFNYQVNVIPGAPSKLRKIQGDGQTGVPGGTTPRALVVEVQDAQGNVLPNTQVTWTIVSGDGTLVAPVNVADREGRVSALVKFGTAPGPVTVRVATEGLAETFTLQNIAPIGTFTNVSGSGQSATTGSAFAQPLVVGLTTPAGTPNVGAVIQFAVTSGSVSLSSASATTNAQGQASMTVRAGDTAGAATITATIAGTTLTFNLTVLPAPPPGPVVTSVVNGASFQAGIAPCAVATLRGTGLLSNPANSFFGPIVGPLPLILGGVSITVGGAAAPLYSVTGTQVNFQVPCEIATGPSVLTVTAQNFTTTTPVTVSDTAPGLFESTTSLNTLQVVAVKANGTYITPQNPGTLGETVTVYATGLPATSTSRFTNQPGAGQTLPTDRVVVGVNNQGMPVTGVQYSTNLIGVYSIQFVLDPALAGTGLSQPFVIAVTSGGQTVYSQGSTLAVRAQ
ncbi:MAG: Ig-like domain-containing protein [Acidobacteria bacterium]|nr:Ig-like domain-containing protein [Acidobacteriota bacterium]